METIDDLGPTPTPGTGSDAYRAGECILAPGSGGGLVYLIRSGRVRLWKPLGDGRRLTLGLLGPNDLFTQAAAGDLSADALTATRVSVFALDALPGLLAVSPALSAAVVGGLLARVGGLQLLAEDLLTRDVPARVAAALLRLAGEGGRAGADGLTLVDLPADVASLAAMVGGARSEVAGALATLRADRAIVRHEPGQLLVDPRRLYRHTKASAERGGDHESPTARTVAGDPARSSVTLGEGNAWFGLLWTRTSDAIALSDPDGVVLAANPAYSDLYGYDLAEVVGKPFTIIFPPDYRATALELYREIFNGPRPPAPVRSEVVRADGTTRRVESRVDFVARGDERVAMVSFIRDISAAKPARSA